MLRTQSCTFPSCQQFHFYFKRVITFSDFQMCSWAKAFEDLANFIHNAEHIVLHASIQHKGWWSLRAELIYTFPYKFLLRCQLRDMTRNIHIYIYLYSIDNIILLCEDFKWCFSSSAPLAACTIWHAVNLGHRNEKWSYGRFWPPHIDHQAHDWWVDLKRTGVFLSLHTLETSLGKWWFHTFKKLCGKEYFSTRKLLRFLKVSP